MKISELVETSGVPLPTVKYYLREGLLPPGRSTGRTRAEYGDEHVHRLAVIRALIEVVGLSVQQVRTILALIETAPRSPAELFDVLGRAVGTLTDASQPAPAEDYPRARAALERLGQLYDPRYAAVAQLERALAAAEAAGVPATPERIDVYGAAMRQVAQFDLEEIPEEPAAAVEYAVVGTAVHGPVLAALRRLAHQDLAAQRLGITGAE
ncbi:MerR family transcriptional regulator [Gryllotalpicola ginsengisoli]|uniref:MerR family transcriptional regulator n=1 Tax=Gryllotalpicola ginsengisoli TaxID=444608 RepID=UPI0003B6FB96|nr:MerR family transcriptional regulator [Gryllotalpicola ginsengisoli]